MDGWFALGGGRRILSMDCTGDGWVSAKVLGAFLRFSLSHLDIRSTSEAWKQMGVSCLQEGLVTFRLSRCGLIPLVFGCFAIAL